MKKILFGIVTAASLVVLAFSALAAAPTPKRITNITTTQAGNTFLPVGYNVLTCDGWVHYKMVATNSATVATTDPMVKGSTKVPSRPIYLNVAAGTQYLALLLNNGSPATCSVTQSSSDGQTGSFTTLAVSSTSALSGATTIGGATTVSAATTLGGTVDAGSLNVDGQTTIGGLARVGGAATVVGATTLLGALQVDGVTKVGLADAGTLAVTGTLNVAGDNILALTKTRGTGALNNASPSVFTATVNTGAICTCSNNTTQTVSVKCAVSGTTLTITGPNTTTDTVSYICLQ